MLFCCTFATRNYKLIAMGTTDRNHEAKQFSLDYLDYDGTGRRGGTDGGQEAEADGTGNREAHRTEDTKTDQ